MYWTDRAITAEVQIQDKDNQVLVQYKHFEICLFFLNNNKQLTAFSWSHHKEKINKMQ